MRLRNLLFLAPFALIACSGSPLGGSSASVDAEAPAFELPNDLGGTTELAGPAVVVFYRGDWCGYCNSQMSDLSEVREQIADQGATLMFVSNEESSVHEGTRARHGFGDETVFLSDPSGEVARQYSGVEGGGVFKSGTYVIDADGTIAAAFVASEPSDRPSSQDVLDALS